MEKGVSVRKFMVFFYSLRVTRKKLGNPLQKLSHCASALISLPSNCLHIPEFSLKKPFLGRLARECETSKVALILARLGMPAMGARNEDTLYHSIYSLRSFQSRTSYLVGPNMTKYCKPGEYLAADSGSSGIPLR
jgi:hypothetical protein